MADNHYTTNSLARKAGVSAAHIRQLCTDGKIPAEKVGRDWVIKKEDGDRWLASRRK